MRCWDWSCNGLEMCYSMENPAWREPPAAFSRGEWEGRVVCATPGTAPPSPNPSPRWISGVIPGIPQETSPRHPWERGKHRERGDRDGARWETPILGMGRGHLPAPRAHPVTGIARSKESRGSREGDAAGSGTEGGNRNRPWEGWEGSHPAPPPPLPTPRSLKGTAGAGRGSRGRSVCGGVGRG